MKKRAYISSYYQSNEDSRKIYLAYLSSSEADEQTIARKKLIDEIVTENNIIQVSQANFEALANLREAASVEEVRYFNLIRSTIEVALQEQRLVAMCNQFGFIPVIKNSSLQKFSFLDEICLNEVELEDRFFLDGSVYIVNTHGRAQTIEGPYQQIMDDKLKIQRILIDACSSASPLFPIKNSGNNSFIDLIAGECLKKNKPGNLEIVGYKEVYTVPDPSTLYAAFVKKEYWPQNLRNLQLLTVADRKTQLENKRKDGQKKSQCAKLNQFELLSKNQYEMVQYALIDVCSKFAKHLLTPIIKQKDKSAIETPESLFLMKMTGEMEAGFNQIRTEGNNKSHGKLINQFKKQRRDHLKSLEPKKLIKRAQCAYDLFYKFRYLNEDIRTSLEVLRSAIRDWPQQDVSPRFFSTPKTLTNPTNDSTVTEYSPIP